MDRSRLFSDAQCSMVKAILNRLIPTDGQRPAAGDANGVSAIEEVLHPNAGLRRSFLDWLVEIELASSRDHRAAFVDLAVDDQTEVLKTVELADPQTFEVVVRLVYRGYYDDPQVLAAFGIDPRPPQPLGFELPAFDAAQLDQVRQRGKLFRDAPV